MGNNLLALLVVTAFLGLAAGQCPVIVKRFQWGARKPRTTARLATFPPTHVIIHHTSGLPCASRTTCIQRVRAIQDKHMISNKWDDIGYNFLIGGDGSVFEGRGWGIKGSHSKPFNSKSIGIAFIGNFRFFLPTLAARNAGRNLIACTASMRQLVGNYKVGGHRQADNTQCPGSKFFGHIKSWPHFTSKL